MTSKRIFHALDILTKVTSEPVKFLQKQPKSIIDNLKHSIDDIQTALLDEFGPESGNIPKLQGWKSCVDNEQLWQYIELINCPLLKKQSEYFSKLNTILSRDINSDDIGTDEHVLPEKLNSGVKLSDTFDDSNLSELSDDDCSDNGEMAPEITNISREVADSFKRRGKSVVDDNFFKLDDMESYLLAEERFEDNRTKGLYNDFKNIDFFDDIPSEDDDEEHINSCDAHYNDFFDAPDTCLPLETIPKTVRFKETNDFSEDEKIDFMEIENVPKTPHEKYRSKLSASVAKLEDENLSDKGWQMMGEATAKVRPENSLLQEFVEYDQIRNAPPIITDALKLNIEDLVILRCKDKLWDDVERKLKLEETPWEYSKTIALDQEKSKQSLAEIYEKEYVGALTGGTEEENVSPECKSINKSLEDIFIKLDALSNFTFAPKPAAPEIKVCHQLPAITMEEVAPVAVADGDLLAPEEIGPKRRYLVKGSTETTKADKVSRTRKMKKRSKVRYEQREKLNNTLLKLGVKLKDKRQARKVDKPPTKRSMKFVSSSQFFTKLQELGNSAHPKKRSSTTKGACKSSKELML